MREFQKASPLAARVIAAADFASGASSQIRSVESLTKETPVWSINDVTDNLEVLELEENFLEMGARGYINAAYRFLFSHWPNDAERGEHLTNLQNGTISATSVFETILNGDQRDNEIFIPSPYDGRFPFRISNRVRLSAASREGLGAAR